jgi:tetratricopeptide (TPR) repeat protein
LTKNNLRIACVVILVSAAMLISEVAATYPARSSAGGPASVQAPAANAGSKTAPTPEAVSKAGRKFFGLMDSSGAMAEAQKKSDAEPKNVELLQKLEQEQVKAWRYQEAVATCTRAITIAPNNAALYVERGHREVGLREFARAIADFNHAEKLDASIGDIYYHRGLAHYFLGEFAAAGTDFQQSVKLAQAKGAAGSDGAINSTNWVYASLRRAGKKDEAAKALQAIGPEVTTKDEHTQVYLNLVRFYQGRIKEADALAPEPPRGGDTFVEPELKFDTSAYQIGNWYLYTGNAAKAREYFARVAKGGVWITWGFVGSEVELQKPH